MLNKEELKRCGNLLRSYQIASCCITGATIPAAIKAILDAQSRVDGLMSVGSKVMDKYKKKCTGDFPPILWDPIYVDQKPQAIVDSLVLVATGFVGSIYEVLRIRHISTREIWQFFRHIRNACFHDNKFRFTKGEPKYPARWRGLEIERKLQDSLLVFDFFALGDFLILVSDVINDIGIPSGEIHSFNEADPSWTL
jgi:hypothetical protein